MRKNIKVISIILLVLFTSLLTAKSIYSKIVENKKVYLIGKLVCIKVDSVNESSSSEGFEKTSYNNLGVITCVNNNNEFVSLGHSIANGSLDSMEANCYSANFTKTVNKNDIEHLNAKINKNDKIGTTSLNTEKGVFGIIDNSSFYDENNSICVGSRYDIKNGSAQIYLDLGNGLQSFDVEITHINYLNETKNISVKITDEYLLNVTGGIAKGMSGTPLVQNNKLVGVINYVATEDSTTGCAIFADKIVK